MGTQVSAGLEGGDAAMLWAGNVGGMSGEMSGQQLDIGIRNSLLNTSSTPLAAHQQFKAPPPHIQSFQHPFPALPTLTDALVHVRVMASKYPGGQDGKQTPTWRMSFLSQQDEQLKAALEAAVDLPSRAWQPLAQAWLPSALTARMEQG